MNDRSAAPSTCHALRATPAEPSRSHCTAIALVRQPTDPATAESYLVVRFANLSKR